MYQQRSTELVAKIGRLRHGVRDTERLLKEQVLSPFVISRTSQIPLKSFATMCIIATEALHVLAVCDAVTVAPECVDVRRFSDGA